MTTDFFVEDYETPVYTRVRCKDCGIIVEKTQL